MSAARWLLAEAVEAEVEAVIGEHAELSDDGGRRRVVRHGYLPERSVETGIGPVAVRRHRVRDRHPGAPAADQRARELAFRGAIKECAKLAEFEAYLDRWPEAVAHWSLTTLREKLIKIGAKVVRHGRYITFQMAEVAIPRPPFAEILHLIDGLRPAPLPP